MKFSKLILMSCIASQMAFAAEEYELWWENSLEKTIDLDTFQFWLGGIDDASRQAFREHLKKKKYSSVLDAACGLCIDYWGLKKDRISIRYQGLDVTPYLVEMGKKAGIPIDLGSIEAIPFDDSSFDLVYGRHIVEHLSGYKKAINESIRVASKEVMITFFIPPVTTPTKIVGEHLIGITKDPNGFLLYHNTYNISEVERFINQNPKVDYYVWDKLERDVILHIYLH